MEAQSTDWQTWVGRTTEAEDGITPRLIASFNATLSPHLAPNTATPLGLHWCLAPDIVEAGGLGPDGHPKKGGFLPPIPLPRRMWAAGDLSFSALPGPADHVTRRSSIRKVEEKQGRSGPLAFVTVHHELSANGTALMEEDHVIVYREAASPGDESRVAAAPTKTIAPAPHERQVDVTTLMLFRYSALTFNGHRIHYDEPYATQVEHYPGLVIHGPLQATLLLNFAAMIGDRTPRRFSFRGTHPATGAQVLTLRALPGEEGHLALEILSADGRVTMQAEARW